jgi:hypothetical protein
LNVKRLSVTKKLTGRSIVNSSPEEIANITKQLEQFVSSTISLIPSISLLGISGTPYRDILHKITPMLRQGVTFEATLNLVGEIKLLAESLKKELLDLKSSLMP